MTEDRRRHWDRVYQTKRSTEVSWYRPHLDTSLALIEQAAPDRAAAVIDVGGGESTLVDDLLARGYANVTLPELLRHLEEVHETPHGNARHFVWCFCRLSDV